VLLRPHHSEGGPESLLARRLLAELHAEDDAATLAMEGLLLELLAVVARAREPSAVTAPPWLERARALIRDLPERRHSLSAIAAEVGVHPTTLARGFRRNYGCTPGELQRRVRLEFAAHQLATSDESLATIAQRAGFFDQSHFTNAFRRCFGTSPQRYRQALHRAH
jgi:AraC-like DNA-binding protein